MAYVHIVIPLIYPSTRVQVRIYAAYLPMYYVDSNSTFSFIRVLAVWSCSYPPSLSWRLSSAALLWFSVSGSSSKTCFRIPIKLYIHVVFGPRLQYIPMHLYVYVLYTSLYVRMLIVTAPENCNFVKFPTLQYLYCM